MCHVNFGSCPRDNEVPCNSFVSVPSTWSCALSSATSGALLWTYIIYHRTIRAMASYYSDTPQTSVLLDRTMEEISIKGFPRKLLVPRLTS